MKNKLKQQNKILVIICLIFVIPSFIYLLFALSNTAVKTEKQAQQEVKEQPITEQPKTVQPQIEQPKTEQSTGETTSPIQKTPETPVKNEQKKDDKKELPIISNNAPQLSLDTANKIELSMTIDEVKKTIGTGTFDSALKAGGTLTGLTIQIPNTNGGIVIGFNDEKVSTITRTYDFPKHPKDKFSNLKKGMSLKDVKTTFGPASIENGGKGTTVLIYKYTVGEEIKDLVVAFDQNDKVLIVS